MSIVTKLGSSNKTRRVHKSSLSSGALKRVVVNPGQLTPAHQVALFRILKGYFQRRVRDIRQKQYSTMAKVIERLDKQRAEQLLRSIKA